MKRWGVLLIGAGGLLVFLVQNRSPVLSLVLFNTKSVALPVGIWLLLAIAAGSLTVFVFIGIIRAWSQTRRNASSASASSYTTSRPLQRDWADTPQASAPSPSSSTKRTEDTPAAWDDPAWQTSAESDWADEDRDFEEWDDAAGFKDKRSPRPSADPVATQTVEDAASPGAYSYRYDDGQASAVGQVEDVYERPKNDRQDRQQGGEQESTAETSQDQKQNKEESDWSDMDYEEDRKRRFERRQAPKQVYDADYRVLIPPYAGDDTSKTSTNPQKPLGDDWESQTEEQDWDFIEDNR